MNSKKGFTLIELLVVIAIIGILSGTVVVSMSGAQGSAKDARIKSSLGQIRTAMEVYKFGAGNGSYAFSDSSVVTLLADIDAQGGTAHVKTASPASAWCVSKVLVGGTESWCIDSAGYNKAGTCSTDTSVCAP